MHGFYTKMSLLFHAVVVFFTEPEFLKFMYFEKATKFCEIFTLLFTGTT